MIVYSLYLHNLFFLTIQFPHPICSDLSTSFPYLFHEKFIIILTHIHYNNTYTKHICNKHTYTTQTYIYTSLFTIFFLLIIFNFSVNFVNYIQIFSFFFSSILNNLTTFWYATLRRTKFAVRNTMKKAMKKPRVLTATKVKNIKIQYIHHTCIHQTYIHTYIKHTYIHHLLFISNLIQFFSN